MHLHIQDMHCDGCARSVRAAILSVDPQAVVTADPPNRSVTVETGADYDAVSKALSEAGFAAERR